MGLTDHLVLPLPPRRDMRPAPAGMVPLDVELQTGLPARVALAPGLVLVISVPTGAPRVWLDLQPATPVFDASVEIDAAANDPTEKVNALPLRFYLVQSGRLVGSAAPRLGLRQFLPDIGPPLIELALLGGTVTAGAIRGLPLTGARLHLAYQLYRSGTEPIRSGQ